MDSFLSRGSYDEYRTELLKRALEEKRKLGLDSTQASVSHSSALQALRCYGMDSGDGSSFGEVEETNSRSRASERRKTIDLYPKQTMGASLYGKQQPSSNLFHSDSKKDNIPLKSILKRTNNTCDISDPTKQHSPYISAIDTPFFLDNAENEDEYLYGKSINEQSVRVSALYAESKSGSRKFNGIIDLDVQNLKKATVDNRGKTSVMDRGSLNFKSFSIASTKNNMSGSFGQNSKSCVNTPVEKSKPSVSAANKTKSKMNLFVEDSKTSKTFSGSNKSKYKVADVAECNIESSNLSSVNPPIEKSKPSVSAANKTKSKMDLFVEDSKTPRTFPDSSKSKCKVDDVAAQNSKSSNLPSANPPIEKSKPSVSAVSKTKSRIDLFVNDSKASKTFPFSNKSKCKVDNIAAQNFKSSNLFGYASLLNFSKGVTKNAHPMSKHEGSTSSQKSESSSNKKPSKPAALGNSASSSPSNKNTLTVKSNADSPSTCSTPLVFRSKSVVQLVPRSIQQLQSKKPVDQYTESKNDCSKTNVQKPSLEKGSPHNSTDTNLSKNSQNCANKPGPKGKSSFTKDEMMLLQYARKRRRPPNKSTVATGEKVEPCPAAKPMINVKIPEPRLILNSPVRKKTQSFSFENTKVSPASKSVSDLKHPVDASTVAEVKALQELQKKEREVNSLLGRKEFLLKLSSIKKKRNNMPFFNQGKRYPQKEFFSKRPFKKPGSFFKPEKRHFSTAKRKGFSEDFNSVRNRYEKKNQKTYRKNICSLSSGNEVYDDKNFCSGNFGVENDIGDSSIVRDSAKVPIHRKSGKIILDFDSERNIPSKSEKQYDNVQSPGKLCTGRNMWCDNNERHGSRGVLLPKRHLSYKSHSREDFDPTPDGYAFDNSPSHSIEWNPSRNTFGGRRRSLDRSPERYSFNDCSGRPTLDRSPGRKPFDESPERHQFDRSCSPHSYTGNPDGYSYDRSPGHHSLDRTDAHIYDESFDHPYDEYHDSYPYDGSPDRLSDDRSCDSLQYNRSPVPFSYDRSPYSGPYDAKSLSPHSQDMSPDSHPYNRSSSNYAYDESPRCGSRSISSGRRSQEMNPRRYPFDDRHQSYSEDGSPGRLSYYMNRRSGKRGPRRGSGDISPRRLSVDTSPRRLSVDTSPRRLSVDTSPRRLSVDTSPRRLSVDMSPRRLSVDMSPRRLSVDVSPRRLSIDISPRRLSPSGSARQFSDDRCSGRLSVELKARKWHSGRQSKSNSCDRSPGRLRKSRIDSYYDNPSRRHRRRPHKEPPKTLKLQTRGRSPESVFDNSSDRFSDRSGKSAFSDLSQRLNTKVPPNCQSCHAMNNSFKEEHCKKPAKTKFPFSVAEIPKQADLLNILDQGLAVPDVKKIVSAIDSLASNYVKGANTEDALASSQSSTFKHLESLLPVPNVQNASQLSTTSATYRTPYENFNQVSNNPQIGYNTEIPQASFPPYNPSAAPPYPSQYLSAFQPQLYQTSQTLTSSVATPPLFSTTTVQTPFSNAADAATTFSAVNTALTSFSDTSATSTVYCDVNSVPPPPLIDAANFRQPPLSAVDAEMYPADQSDYFASDGSLERVSTLTSIPLESNKKSDDELLKKKYKSHNNKGAATMKFITPDKIEKLLRQKSDIRKQMACLKNEFEKLQKMQGDAMRRKRRENDGHKDLLLLEYSKMQEEIKTHIHKFIDDVKGIEQELEDGFLGCTSEKDNKKDGSTLKDSGEKESKTSGEGSSETESKKYYDFFDSGSHWCKHCNILCTTMTGMLEHLKSDEHAECTHSVDKSWATKPTSDCTAKSIQKGEKISQPIKGVEFIMPIEGFYCSLCKEFYEKTSYMQEHLRSSRHFESYQCYTAENSSYERQWLLDRIARLSVIEIQDRKRQSGEENNCKRRKKETEEIFKQKQEEDEEEEYREKKMQDEVEGERHMKNEEDRERLREKLEDARRLKEKDDDDDARRLREREDVRTQREKEDDARRSREKEEHAKRLGGKEEEFNPKEMDDMHARIRWKHRKEVEKKRHGVEEEELMEDNKNFKHKTKAVDQLSHGIGGRENIKGSEDQIKHGKAEEKTWEVIDAKQEEPKRKQSEENEVPKKKLKIMSNDEEDGQISGRLVGARTVKDQQSEKLSKAEMKWKPLDKQKELLSRKATEPKFKPRQTVVYIGRAPNFKLHNKGISSFRANLLKLAVEKKEAESGFCKDYQLTSGSVASFVENKTLPVSTSSLDLGTPSSSEQVLMQGTENKISASDVNINIRSVPGPCSEEQQVAPSQDLGVHVSNFVKGNCNDNTISYALSGQHAGKTGIRHQNLVTYPTIQQHSVSASSETSVTNAISNIVSSQHSIYSSYDGNTAITVANTILPATPMPPVVYSTASAFTSAAPMPTITYSTVNKLPSAAPMTTAVYSTVNVDFSQAPASFMNPTGVPGNTYAAISRNFHYPQQANVPENVPPQTQVHSHASPTSAEGVSSTPVGDCRKTAKEKLCRQKKAGREVYGPLTEEDEDLLLLGINKEDQVPLVFPKPPPVSLIRSCTHKEEKDVPEVSESEIPPVVPDSDSSAVQQCRSSTKDPGSSQSAVHVAGSLQQHGMCSSSDTSTISSSNIENMANNSCMAAAHQSYSHMYNASAVQPQNIKYSTAVQANLGTMYGPFNCTNTSSVQQSYTYPYNSNTDSLNNFQGTFMMPNQKVNNMGPFPMPQVPPPGQFQSAPPPMGYAFQGPPPRPEYFNSSQQNVHFGALPQTQFPPPYVKSANNYSPARFCRDFGPRAQMPRPTKKWRKQRMPAGVSKREWPANKGPSSLKVEEQEADMKASEKPVSSETPNIQRCTSDSSSRTTTLAGSTAESKVSFLSEVVSNKLSNARIVPGESECDASDCFAPGVIPAAEHVESSKIEDKEVILDNLKADNKQLLLENVSVIALENSSLPAYTMPVNKSGVSETERYVTIQNSVITSDKEGKQGVAGYNTESASSSTNEQIQAPGKSDHSLAVPDPGNHITHEGTSQEEQPSNLEIGGNSESIEGKACI